MKGEMMAIYEYRKYLDLADEKTKEMLERIETEIAQVFIDNLQAAKFLDDPMLGTQISGLNEEIITVVFSKIVSSSYSTNEMLQSIADALTTLVCNVSDEEYKIEIVQSNSDETWTIKGRDFNS